MAARPWASSVSDVLQAHGVTLSKGLTPAQVVELRKEYGPNELDKEEVRAREAAAAGLPSARENTAREPRASSLASPPPSASLFFCRLFVSARSLRLRRCACVCLTSVCACACLVPARIAGHAAVEARPAAV